MARYDYWTHGVSTAVENMDDVHIQRFGWGTTVRQHAGGDNWFHFAVPTPTVVDDDETIGLAIMAFHAETKNGAVIKEWHAYMGETPIGSYPDFEPTDGTDQHVYRSWRTRNYRVTGPVGMSLRVEFPRDDSEITFQGAGAGFED